MPTLSIEYSDQQMSILLQVMSRLQTHSQRLRPVLADMGEYLVGATDDRFDSQMGPDGVRWQRNAPSTWKRKRVKKILTESTNLPNRVVYQVSEAAVEIGTNVTYGAIHQFGGEIEWAARSTRGFFKVNKHSGKFEGFASKRRANFEKWMTLPDYTQTMPARPFLGVSQSDSQELTLLLQGHLRRMIKEG